MSKLVDKERLAKLAKELDKRAKAAVAAEAERALAAEQAIEAKADANAAAINAINNAETGILAQAKAHAQGLVDDEKERAEEQEGLLSGRIETLEGIVGSEAEGAFGEVKKDVSDNKAAIAKLNGEADEEGSVKKAVADAVKVEKDRAEGVEAGFETRIAANEAFVTAQPTVDAEQDRRIKTLEGLISGGEGDGNALDQLQESINSKVAQADYDLKVANFEGRIAANEAFVAAHDDTARDARIKALEDNAPVKQAAIEAAQAAADAAQADADALEQRLDAKGGLVDRIEANETTIAKLDGAVDVEGSVKQQIKDAIATVNQAAEDLTGRVAANEAFVAGYAAKEQKVREDFAAADAQVLADAKKYADEEITKLVDSAPEAMNTLNELATAIKANKDVYDGYVAEHATAMATMKSDLQKEIDADVKVVADELAKQKDAKQEGTLAKQIADEVARATAEEADIRADFAAEDKKLAGQIKAVESMLGLDSGEGETGAFAQVQADIAALQGTVGDAEKGLVKDVADLKAADQALQDNIDLKVAQDEYNTKVAALEKADTDLGTRIAAFEADGALDVAAKEVRLAAAEKDIDNLQAFVAAQPGKDQAMQQAIQANADAITAETKKDGARDVAIKAAIDKEVENRDAAIAEELKAYSDTAAVKTMLSNVINSLGLAIKDNKLQLTLGTSDYVIKEVELDLATDADIEAIIAGLDAQ